jgi:hypothetical protein
MFDGPELDAAERLVDDWQARIEERAAAARQLSARLAELTGSARSDDGLVEVTVGPFGTVTGLDLDEGIRNRSAAATAQAILATMRAAQAALTEAATTATDETVGADTPTGRAVIASYTARLDRAGD